METTIWTDLREEMHEDGINQYDMMYKTDHHWTTHAGFYAYTKIATWLEQELNCVVDDTVKSFDSYTVERYPEWLLGSRGQRTGIYYAGIDDFDLIKPNFETNLIRKGVSGTFDDVVINTDLLATRNFSLGSPYDYVLGDSLNDFKNPNALNDKSILVVTDSMGKAVNPFLILSFGEIRRINPLDSNMITAELIEEYDPGAVVFLYYITTLFNESTFQFDVH